LSKVEREIPHRFEASCALARRAPSGVGATAVVMLFSKNENSRTVSVRPQEEAFRPITLGATWQAIGAAALLLVLYHHLFRILRR